MVPLFETERPRRLTVLRFAAQRGDAPGDRAAHWLLTVAWSKFLAVLAGFYLIAATLFAVGFQRSGPFGTFGTFGAGGPVSFADAFFMSLQALTVFGCGRLAPATPLGKGLVIAAVFVGWLALLLGLAMTMVRFIRLRPFWRPDSPLPRDETLDKEAPPAREPLN